MTHRANWRPIKFLERQSGTYRLLRSVQCHFLLVGREGAGGASEAWDVGGERERGDGAGLPAAASDGPLQWSLPCQSELLHLWFTSKGKSKRVSELEEAQKTWPSLLLRHEGTASPLLWVTRPGQLPRACKGAVVGMRPSA